VVDTTVLPTGPTGGADSDLAAGDTVGENKVDCKLGQGGFGAVYRATHPLIGKVAAIKILSRQFSATPEMVSRFIAEARAVNQIRHPNIIDIFSFGTLPDGRHYYVMEYLDGDPLDVHVKRRRRMPVADALPILRGIAKALDAAHAKGIAHRDLKAENVILARTPEGEAWPKLLDFGIAKLSGDDTLGHKTRTGAPMGTPAYMSPEQARGKSDVDYRTDLYAFGVLAYVMLTGRFPLDGEDYMTILMRQISDEPEPPSVHVPELSAAIDETIAWLMRKEPAERPPNALTAVQALEGLVPAPPAPRAQTTANMRAPRIVTAEERAATTQPPETGQATTLPPATRRTAWIVGIGGVVALAAVATIVMLRSGREQAPRQTPVVVVPDAAQAVASLDAAAAVEIDAPAPSRYVTIEIAGTPPNTRVKIGTDVVGIAPGPVTLERFDAPSLVLVLEADGYKPGAITVTADQLAYTATLKKRGGGTRPRPPRPGSATSEPTDDIDQFPN
jgi:serine/threonine-protein kinase